MDANTKRHRWRFRLPKGKKPPPHQTQLEYFSPPAAWYPPPRWQRVQTQCPGQRCNHTDQARPHYRRLPKHLVSARGHCYERIFWDHSQRWKRFCELEDIHREDLPSGFTPYQCADDLRPADVDQARIAELLWHLSPWPQPHKMLCADLGVAQPTLNKLLRCVRLVGIPVAVCTVRRQDFAFIARQYWAEAKTMAERLWEFYRPLG